MKIVYTFDPPAIIVENFLMFSKSHCLLHQPVHPYFLKTFKGNVKIKTDKFITFLASFITYHSYPRW